MYLYTFFSKNKNKFINSDIFYPLNDRTIIVQYCTYSEDIFVVAAVRFAFETI